MCIYIRRARWILHTTGFLVQFKDYLPSLVIPFFFHSSMESPLYLGRCRNIQSTKSQEYTVMYAETIFATESSQHDYYSIHDFE